MSAGEMASQHVREMLSEALASPLDLALADSREPPILGAMLLLRDEA